MNKYLCIAIIAIFALSCENKTEIGNIKSTNLSIPYLKSKFYYWGNKEKIELSIIGDKKFILITDDEFKKLSNGVAKREMKKLSPQDSPKIERLENLRWGIIDSRIIRQNSINTIYEADNYMTSSGKEVVLSNIFYVKLKREQDFHLLQRLAQKYNVLIFDKNEYMPLWYQLYCMSRSKGDALQIANIFYESGLFEASQPSFIEGNIALDINDPLYPRQWNLNNTEGVDIRYESARSITKGSPDIKIALIDHGVDLAHNDINIYDISWDSETSTSPSVIRGYHGTPCAGIICGKTNNGIGIAGIAPNCKIMSISNNLISNYGSGIKLANAINFAWKNGADIISNSWGTFIQYDCIDDAVDNALSKGREGKGCVFVAAIGNNDMPYSLKPSNSNGDVISVGAISRAGKRVNKGDGFSWGSNYGAYLDVVAPGDKIPTTLSGNLYMNDFGGTSAACPQVSGVAALILSVRPDLSQKSVKAIISKTSQKLENYAFSTNKQFGVWNNEVGYGLVDAHAALLMAQSFNINAATEIQDITFVKSKTYNGGSFLLKNVIVKNNSTLKITFRNNLSIYHDFLIEKGSSIEILKEA